LQFAHFLVLQNVQSCKPGNLQWFNSYYSCQSIDALLIFIAINRNIHILQYHIINYPSFYSVIIRYSYIVFRNDTVPLIIVILWYETVRLYKKINMLAPSTVNHSRVQYAHILQVSSHWWIFAFKTIWNFQKLRL